MKKTITIDTNLHKVMPIHPTKDMLENDMLEDYGTGYTNILALVPDTLHDVVVHSGKPNAYWFMGRFGGAFKWARQGRPVSDEVTELFTHPPAQPDAEALKARITALEFDNQALRENSASIIKNLADENAELETQVRDNHETHMDLVSQIAAQAGQWPVAPNTSIDKLIERVCGTAHAWACGAKYGHDELNNRTAANETVKELKVAIASSSRTDNATAIVQAALEAACTAVWETEHDDRQKVLDDIRAIDKQAIIDAARGK